VQGAGCREPSTAPGGPETRDGVLDYGLVQSIWATVLALVSALEQEEDKDRPGWACHALPWLFSFLGHGRRAQNSQEPGARGQEPGARTRRVAEQESPVVEEERTVVGVGAAATQSRRGQASTPYRLPMAGNSLGRLRW
jgi:hypothetical protein